MKATKKETIRIIRDILSGRSGHDSVRIRPLGLRSGYDVYTSIGIGYYDCEPSEGEFVLKHDRNECTLAEADEILSHLEKMC